VKLLRAKVLDYLGLRCLVFWFLQLLSLPRSAMLCGDHGSFNCMSVCAGWFSEG
jgi:hypothetical protein